MTILNKLFEFKKRLKVLCGALTMGETMNDDKALKDLITGLSDLLLLVSNASKGFSFSEIGEAVSVLGDIPTITQEAPKLLAQYKGLGDTERADLMAYVAATVKFPANAEVEVIVEKVLDVGVALSAVVQVLVPVS